MLRKETLQLDIKHKKATPVVLAGDVWLTIFTKRHPKSRMSRAPNFNRADIELGQIRSLWSLRCDLK